MGKEFQGGFGFTQGDWIGFKSFLKTAVKFTVAMFHPAGVLGVLAGGIVLAGFSLPLGLGWILLSWLTGVPHPNEVENSTFIKIAVVLWCFFSVNICMYLDKNPIQLTKRERDNMGY